jgi:hypothetical protein
MSASWVIYIFLLGILVLLYFYLTGKRLEYRLGDVYRGTLLSAPYRYIWIPLSYPSWSIARQYAASTSRPMNIDVLDTIVPRQAHDGIVVHLRLGDVFEMHTRTVAEFLSSELDRNDASNGERYVQPLLYYKQVIDASAGYTTKKVTLIGGTHKALSMVKSMQYVDAITELFRHHGFEVIRRISSEPSIRRADRDFSMMVNAAFFVPSGGGFSKMAAQLARKRNAIVWSNTEDTWSI